MLVLHLILSKSTLSHFFKHLILELNYCLFTVEILGDFLNALCMGDIKQEEFIWYDAELLESEGLRASAWETFDYPGFTFFF